MMAACDNLICRTKLALCDPTPFDAQTNLADLQVITVVNHWGIPLCLQGWGRLGFNVVRRLVCANS